MFEDLRSFFKNPQNALSRQEPISGGPSNAKRSIIAVVNQKGGVGKTTTCINLAAGLAKRGLKVLIIDLDPQSNASLGLGVDTDHYSTSIYDVLVHNADLDQAIVQTYQKNLEIAPASSMLTGAQLEIADLLGRERLLRTAIYKMLATSSRNYDYILLDCSPSLNLLTINGLATAKHVLVPMQTHYFSLEGMKELFSTLKVVKDRINPELEVLGILPAIVDVKRKHSQEMIGQLREYFKEKMLTTMIRMNTVLAEAAAHGRSIFDHSPNSNGAKDYAQLVDEVVALTQAPANGVWRVESALSVRSPLGPESPAAVN